MGQLKFDFTIPIGQKKRAKHAASASIWPAGNFSPRSPLTFRENKFIIRFEITAKHHSNNINNENVF